ncbi:uncharacterized protein LOC129592330 [Paramacrobiotus metropolitanus]|uniref:uncharacterized protein LOC129592330 n=1 Tax=Paramacrobiotus metropolitanus TaxID=2943436 RepID=UPI002445969E|nr:uncharacterized protein LOC129592330 [Paramacrobiotus metropolitanus]
MKPLKSTKRKPFKRFLFIDRRCWMAAIQNFRSCNMSPLNMSVSATGFQYARKKNCDAGLTVAARLSAHHLIVTKKNLRHNHPENRDPEQIIAVRERLESRAPAVATANQARTRSGKAVTLTQKPLKNGRTENDKRRERYQQICQQKKTITVVMEMHEEGLSWVCTKKKPKTSESTLEQPQKMPSKEAISSDECAPNDTCMEIVEPQQPESDNVGEEKVVQPPPYSQEDSEYTVHGFRGSELKALQHGDPGNKNRQGCSFSNDQTSVRDDTERISAGIHLSAGHIEEVLFQKGSKSTPEAMIKSDYGRSQAYINSPDLPEVSHHGEPQLDHFDDFFGGEYLCPI